jgi:hypothetical protein
MAFLVGVITLLIMHEAGIKHESGTNVDWRIYAYSCSKYFPPQPRLLPGKVIGVLLYRSKNFLEDPVFMAGGNYYLVEYYLKYVEERRKTAMTYLPWYASTFPTQTDKQQGINLPPYSLVEIEVNFGRGSQYNQRYVAANIHYLTATNIKRVDGSKEYPLDVMQVMQELNQRYQVEEQADIMDQKKEIDAAKEEIRTKAIGNFNLTDPWKTGQDMCVNWLPESEQLEVRFYTTIANSVVTCRPPRHAREVYIPSETPCLSVRFGVSLGRFYEVGKDGKLNQTTILPITTFAEHLHPS